MDSQKLGRHTRFTSLLNELKERKVLRVAIAYVVVAWIVMQVGEVTFVALKLPPWSQSLLVIFSLLGFPIALVMAWAYEITPDGIVEDHDGNPASHAASGRSRYDREKANADSSLASIAVLPFEDMSFDQDQTYFCEGVAEEILCALCEVDGLHVAARVASFQFGGKSADILEIGRKLNVSVVLEGSVRKSEEKIRITVQLIDAHDGYQFWAGQYNHDLKDIFDIQEQIAQAVVNAMRLSIGDNLLTRPMTQSTEAYDLYLKGNSYFIRPDKQNILFARQLFEHAVDIDPEYGRAWAKLASTYAYEYLCAKPNENAREEARRISKKALRLAPGIPDTHIARGIAYSICRDFKQADLEFEIAIGLEPGSFSAWFTWARSKTYQGDVRKAIECYQKASEIRPEGYRCDLIQMTLLVSLGEHNAAREKAKEGLRKAKDWLELNPDDNRAWNMGAFALHRLGEVDEAEKWMNTSLVNSPRNSELTYNAASFYSLAGDVEKSLEYLSQAADSGCLNVSWLEQDSDLDAVRDKQRFNEIVAQFKG
jgi:TolB-like protein/Tfp pilus assembly protein PilF